MTHCFTGWDTHMGETVNRRAWRLGQLREGKREADCRRALRSFRAGAHIENPYGSTLI